MMTERMARAGVVMTLEPGSLQMMRSVAAQSVERTWDLLVQGAYGAAPQARAQRAESLLEEVTAPVGTRRFVIPGDEEWPAALDDLEHAEPLHDVGGPPLGVWLRGTLCLRDVPSQAVAIVGSRAATAYGCELASDLAAGLAGHGVPIVSGGAYGIDAAAHRGALAAEGATVCVLASGVDVTYPAGNTGLIESITRQGVLVSEYAPGAHPTRLRFLARNRLIASLSLGTVLVEAAARSGARNTVSWAHSLNRTVMAAPGPVTSAQSVTPHRLIRDHEASLVTCDAEIVDLLRPVGQVSLFDAVGPSRALDSIDPVARSVYEALPGRGTATAEALVLESGQPWPVVAAALTRLEAQGLVLRQATGFGLAAKRGSEATRTGRGMRLVVPAGG